MMIYPEKKKFYLSIEKSTPISSASTYLLLSRLNK